MPFGMRALPGLRLLLLCLALGCGLAAPAAAASYVTPPSTIWTIAGTGTACATPTGACGDGPTATTAQLNRPSAVAVDGAGNVYIADVFDHKVRKRTPAG